MTLLEMLTGLLLGSANRKRDNQTTHQDSDMRISLLFQSFLISLNNLQGPEFLFCIFSEYRLIHLNKWQMQSVRFHCLHLDM